MHAKRLIPIKLVLSLIVVLLSLSLAHAHPQERCENLTAFFDPLGQLVVDNTTEPPTERLCRKVFKAQKKVNKGKIAKAIKKLNKFIKITNNHTPEHMTEAAAMLLTTEAGRLIGILEDNMGLPKDPGTAGKATLEGIDSDNDGVRDDLQRFIALTHTDSAKLRALLTQQVKLMQQYVLVANDKALSIQVNEQVHRTALCVDYIAWILNRQLDDEFDDYSLFLLAKALNTVDRSRAYIKYNTQLVGRVVFDAEPLRYDLTPLKAYCDFNPDELPN